MPVDNTAKKARVKALGKSFKSMKEYIDQGKRLEAPYKNIKEDPDDPETWPKYQNQRGEWIPLATDMAMTDSDLEDRERRLKKWKPSGKYPIKYEKIQSDD